MASGKEKRGRGERRGPSPRKRRQPRTAPKAQPTRARRARLPFETEFVRVKAVFDRHRQRLMALPGVTGVDVGVKLRGPEQLPNGRLAIRVFVDRKLPPRAAEFSGARPSRVLLPRTIERIPLDVIASQFQWTRASVQAAGRIAPQDEPGNWGTVTMGVRLSKDGSPCLLTCAHVLAGFQPLASIDNSRVVMDERGQPIGHSLAGQHLHWFCDEHVDAGLVKLFPEVELLAGLPGLGTAPEVQAITASDQNRALVKRATVGEPSPIGLVRSVTSDFWLSRTPHGTAAMLVRDHILIEADSSYSEFARQGDSGAAVLTLDNRLVGMIRAVDLQNPRRVLACRILQVLDRLPMEWARPLALV